MDEGICFLVWHVKPTNLQSPVLRNASLQTAPEGKTFEIDFLPSTLNYILDPKPLYNPKPHQVLLNPKSAGPNPCILCLKRSNAIKPDQRTEAQSLHSNFRATRDHKPKNCALLREKGPVLWSEPKENASLGPKWPRQLPMLLFVPQLFGRDK